MTFYRFVRVTDADMLVTELRERAAADGLVGTVVVAGEGINGTLAGARGDLESFADRLAGDARFADMPFRFSRAGADNPVFHRLKVRLKARIVAFGAPVDVLGAAGRHVDAAAWNALLDDPEVLLVDTRNAYERAVGTFPGAIDPGTTSFRQFPAFVAERLDAVRDRRIAMFCTGGIRCETASSYLKSLGFEEVLQLRGGILGYLATVAEDDNRWQGECFVFDQRVTVTKDLEQGAHAQCHACRRPLSADDLASPAYRRGESCPDCHERLSPRQRSAFAERARQERLAAARGERHLGYRAHGRVVTGPSRPPTR